MGSGYTLDSPWEPGSDMAGLKLLTRSAHRRLPISGELCQPPGGRPPKRVKDIFFPVLLRETQLTYNIV